MSAGTIALTNNSTTVKGTGTAFTAELKAGDFVGVIVGGAPYTLVVANIVSNTQLTIAVAYNGPSMSGLAWYAVPATLQVAITQKILNDMGTIARGMILEKANWQGFYTATGDATINLPDGTSVTGPSWPSMKTTLAKAYNDGGLLNSTVTPNSLGNAADFNIYYQTANANALIANGYPIAKAGSLFVTKSAYGCQQMYITFQGEAFVRGLTGTFNPAAPNWSDWWPIFTGKSTIPVANGGTGAISVATAPFAAKANPSFTGNGNISGTFTAGGQITAGPGGLNTSSNTNSTVQGTSVGWNSLGISGGSDMVCNRGTGEGGFRFRIVNQQNSAVIQDFTMNNAGVGQSTGGWQAVCDIDVKDNVVEIDPETALEALTSWRTCTWQYMDTPSEYDENGKVTATVKGAMGVGFIAQDVQKDCPEAVTLVENPQLFVTKEGELFTKSNMLSLNTSGASAAYAGASIKALKKRNEDQAELISALLKRLDTVETKLGIKNDSWS